METMEAMETLSLEGSDGIVWVLVTLGIVLIAAALGRRVMMRTGPGLWAARHPRRSTG